MASTNSSTKDSTKKKRNPIVQVVLKPEVHKQFIQRCEDEQRSESSMGAILIAQALNNNAAPSDTSPL